jgi:tripartite-type tricarboxylate transporter receptor subunit TctC
VAELGYPKYTFITYYGVFGPAGLSPSIVARLNTDLNRILASDDVKKQMHAQGLEPDPMTPEAFAALIKADIQKSKDVITAANIKVE